GAARHDRGHAAGPHPREETRVGTDADPGAELPRHEPVAALAGEARPAARLRVERPQPRGRIADPETDGGPPGGPARHGHEQRDAARARLVLEGEERDREARALPALAARPRRGDARRRGRAEELLHVSGRALRDPDPARARVAVDDVIGGGSRQRDRDGEERADHSVGGWMTWKTAPTGPWSTAIRPMSGRSIGSITTL